MSALLEGYRVASCLLYFGGIILPYGARDVRWNGINYMTIGSVERSDDEGWDDELPLLYYRDLLNYKFDPFEAAAFEDEYWRKRRVRVVLVRGTEVIRLQAIHLSSLKHLDYPDPVKKLEACFQTLHMFRVFDVSST